MIPGLWNYLDKFIGDPVNETDLDAILRRSASIRIYGAVVFHANDAVQVLSQDVPALVGTLRPYVQAMDLARTLDAENELLTEELNRMKVQEELYRAALAQYADPENWVAFRYLNADCTWETRYQWAGHIHQHPADAARMALEYSAEAVE